MYLGIEIGGTKLQMGVGVGDGSPLVDRTRLEVDPSRGAAGILDQIQRSGSLLVGRHPVSRIGIGFGGPVDTQSGHVIKSHHVDGWDDMPLVDWCGRTFGLAAELENDCNAAAVAEARFGAGRDARSVFYVTVGTGIGGGLVLDGQSFGTGRPAVAEIGHLRPGLHADRPEEIIEASAAGWGIEAAARARLTQDITRPLAPLRDASNVDDGRNIRQRLEDARQAAQEFSEDLLARCDGDPAKLTTKMVVQAAEDGNEIARDLFDNACQALGWGIAQVVTLMAPQLVVVGGGISLVGEQRFFVPLRHAVRRYVFPPLLDSYTIVPAELGEWVVVHGALALAKSTCTTTGK